MDTEIKLVKKEKRFFKKQEKQKEQEKEKKTRKIRKILKISLMILIMGGGILGLGWFLATKASFSESEIVVKQGLHWHVELDINILGKYQEVPANIGIGVVHQPIHTHEPNNVIHLEFSGLVKENDIKLGRFFDVWGKKFNKNCILDKCSVSGGELKMFINGEPNFEFENYIMKDNDKIKIELLTNSSI